MKPILCLLVAGFNEACLHPEIALASYSPMSIYEFNQLSKEQKADFTYAHWQFLMNCLVSPHRFACLYYCQAAHYREEYFIELWYNAGQQEVDAIVSFRSTKLLELYLELVELEGI